MPSVHVCSNLGSATSPQFSNQAPPWAQQLRLPDFLLTPHLGHRNTVSIEREMGEDETTAVVGAVVGVVALVVVVVAFVVVVGLVAVVEGAHSGWATAVPAFFVYLPGGHLVWAAHPSKGQPVAPKTYL